MSHVIASYVCRKKYFLQSNFLERILNFFYHVFGILNNFSNPRTPETIYYHFLVIFKNVVQTDNLLRV